MTSRSFPIAAAAAFCVTGCGLGGPAYKAPPAAVAQTIEMTLGLDYSPGEATIVVGQTVEWRNQSLFDHTVTADVRLAKNPANVALPNGAQPFNSGSIKAGQVYRRTFTVPGTYRYFCIPHEGKGMVGVLHVRPRA